MKGQHYDPFTEKKKGLFRRKKGLGRDGYEDQSHGRGPKRKRTQRDFGRTCPS